MVEPVEFLRFLICKNERCGQPMLLPDSSPLGRFLIPLGSHEDARFEVIVCPECDHVYDYKHTDVHRRQSQLKDRDHLERLIGELLNFDCAVESCETRVVIEKPNQAGREGKAIVADSKSWKLAGVHCKKGHQQNEIPAKCWAGIRPSDS